jgi:hypothetical protein
VVSGRIMNLTEELYHVNTDMMQPSTITFVPVNELESIEPSPVSMMPPGLINSMSKDDVLDLLAYFISGGDPEHSAFNDRDL